MSSVIHCQESTTTSSRPGTNGMADMDDARLAVETGVDGLDIVIGTSPQLMQHSHGKSMDYIRDTALEVNSPRALWEAAIAR